MSQTAGITPDQYIHHHLSYWTVGNGGFWTLHVDTLLVSVVLALVFFFSFWVVARKVSSGVPGKGRLVIHYSSLDELDGILARIR
ncbi:MAG: hypothetical protein ACRESE_04495 [Gammaproteobacteria bacterium]